MNRVAVKSVRRRGEQADRQTAVTESGGARAASCLVLTRTSSYLSAELDVEESLLNYYRPGLNVPWLILFCSFLERYGSWSMSSLSVGSQLWACGGWIFPQVQKVLSSGGKALSPQGNASFFLLLFYVRARISEHSSAFKASSSCN